MTDTNKQVQSTTDTDYHFTLLADPTKTKQIENHIRITKADKDTESLHPGFFNNNIICGFSSDR